VGAGSRYGAGGGPQTAGQPHEAPPGPSRKAGEAHRPLPAFQDAHAESPADTSARRTGLTNGAGVAGGDDERGVAAVVWRGAAARQGPPGPPPACSRARP
jgi:hypothetical protein